MLDLDLIQDSPHLLDVLIQMEDVLDSLDLYVFPNWFQGELVSGPKVRRYWFDMTLRYPIDKMPCERGAKRLIKHGIRVDYQKAVLSDKAPKANGKDPDPTHWEILISIPRRLLSDMNAAELDTYDDEVEVEDVQDAQDSGMNDETAYHDDAGEEDGNSEQQEPTDDQQA